MMNNNGNEFTRYDLMSAALALKAQGASDAQIEEVIGRMQRGDVEMSRTDGVTMVKNEGNVSGAYVDADQKLQDAYANSPVVRAQMQAAAQGTPPGFFPTMGDLNAGFIPVVSPNTRVETEGQRKTVKADGTTVIY